MATRNQAWAQAMQEARRSNATTPHRNKSKYTRKRKHRDRDRD